MPDQTTDHTTGHPTGTVFVIVGPSGSGKDTLINWLRAELQDRREIQFVRRIVTRPSDKGHEDHDTMELAQFLSAKEAGAFATTWQAHDLHYAIPASAKDHVDQGGLAILNGARRALGQLEAAFARLQIIHLDVDPAILAGRLTNRGRNSDTNLSARLAQQKLYFQAKTPIIHVTNDGPVEEAGRQIVKLIEQRHHR